jgi:hypothetical protein
MHLHVPLPPPLQAGDEFDAAPLLLRRRTLPLRRRRTNPLRETVAIYALRFGIFHGLLNSTIPVLDLLITRFVAAFTAEFVDPSIAL